MRDGGGDTLQIATVPRNPEDIDALIEQETAILRTRRKLRFNQENDFATFTSMGMLNNFRQITGGVAAVMILIAGISLVVGGVGVRNIMLVNVTQRTREIGLREALGGTRRDLAVQFLAEAVTLTGVGGLPGIAFGRPGRTRSRPSGTNDASRHRVRAGGAAGADPGAPLIPTKEACRS